LTFPQGTITLAWEPRHSQVAGRRTNIGCAHTHTHAC